LGSGARPKRDLDELYEELADEIHDAILMEFTEDRSLEWLLRLALVEILDRRPVFPNPMHEPVLWRKFVRWTEDALEDAKEVKKTLDKASQGPYD
jgi:hypothetical protein